MRLGKSFKMALVLASGLSVTLVGCGSKSNEIDIGAAGPFTGSLSKIGLDSLNAVKMAVDSSMHRVSSGGKRSSSSSATTARILRRRPTWPRNSLRTRTWSG